jgi:hypothetical protein
MGLDGVEKKKKKIRNEAVRQFIHVSCLETKDAGTKTDEKRTKATD